MTLLKRLAGIFTGLLCITGISLTFTQKPNVPFIIMAILFGTLTFILFKPTEKEKQKKIDKQEKRREKLKTCTMKHINGLPIAEDVKCNITLTDDKYIFSSSTMNFELDKSKITDICIKTDTEIQQQYVSSVGGAVVGGALFGPLGAMIGGRAKKKTIKHEVHNYLIITYQSDEIKYIGFDTNLALASAHIYVEDFKNSCNNNLTYQL